MSNYSMVVYSALEVEYLKQILSKYAIITPKGNQGP